MKRIANYVRENWLRMIVSAALLCLSFHWGGFGSMGVIPGAVAVLLLTK